jgi:GntR family transcriptional regulator
MSAVREQLELGNWKPGDLIPGEPELCRLFGVSRSVIRQALREMAYQGLVVREKGRGTFVASPKLTETAVQELSGFFQDATSQGLEPFSQVLRQGVVLASETVAARLEVKPGTPVVEIERLRFVGEEPLVLTTTYLPLELCGKLVDADLSRRSLYEFLATECGLTLARGRRTIEAVAASEYEARLLRVKKGAPLILLHSVSYLEDGTPIEYYHAHHRGDRSVFEVELVRSQQYGAPAEAGAVKGIGALPRGGGAVIPERSS